MASTWPFPSSQSSLYKSGKSVGILSVPEVIYSNFAFWNWENNRIGVQGLIEFSLRET